MKLTIQEEKIARLALDKGARDGERAAAANKLIESLYRRGITVEDIERNTIVTQTVYRDRVPVSPPKTPKKIRSRRPGLVEAFKIWNANGYRPPQEKSLSEKLSEEFISQAQARYGTSH